MRLAGNAACMGHEKGKGNVVLLLNQVPYHEDLQMSGSTASCPSHFTAGKEL